MKKAFFNLIIFPTAFFIFSCNSNKKTIWVYDIEHDLTTEQINKLDSLFKSHEKITSNEIALVTTSDYGTDTSIAEFGKNFGKKYGVGKKVKNNGVVIVFSRAKKETNISTGYGTEIVLTNKSAKTIIDSFMIPEFKHANFYEGILNGSKAIIEILEKPGNRIN